MGIYLPHTLEQDLLDRKNRALQYYQQGRDTDPQTVARFMSIGRNWPSLHPSAALGFAQAGLDAHAAEVRDAARLSVKQRINMGAWTKAFDKHPDKHPGGAVTDDNKKSSLDNLSASELLDLQTRFHTDQTKHWDGKLSAKAFTRKWGMDLENNPDAIAGLNRAITYQLGQRDQAEVETLIRAKHGPKTAYANLDDYRGHLAKANAISAIKDSTKAFDTSLPARAFKGAVREANVVMNAGLQSTQAMIRNVASGGTPTQNANGQDIASQTDLGQQIIHGYNVGDGFLPDPHSEAGEAALSSQKAAAPTIGGHAYSLGRATANVFFEPDTTEFNVTSGLVDAGVAYAPDPASNILGMIGDVRANASRFLPEVTATAQATGAFPTVSRVHLDQTTKGQFLGMASTDRTIAKFFDEVAGENNPSKAMRWFNNANPASPLFPIETPHGQQLIAELATAGAARDIEGFKDAFARASSVQDAFKAPGVSYSFKKGIGDSRVFATMPRGVIPDPTDKNTTWKILDDTMRAAKVPIAQRDTALNAYIRDPNPFAGITAVEDMIKTTLVHSYGVDPVTAAARASFFPEAHNVSRLYDLDQATGLERVRPGIAIAGEGHVLPGPSLETEGLSSAIAIPDTRALRRQASDFNYLTATKPWHVTQTALRAPQAVWSPLQILSARQAVRDFGETQLNMAGRGMTNFFHDPIDTISMIMGSNVDKRWERWLEKVPGLHPTYTTDPEGYNLLAESDDLLMHSALQFSDPDTVMTKGFISVPITHKEAGFGLAEELGRMHGDPIMRGVSEAADPAAAKAWFRAPEQAELRTRRAPIVKAIDDHNMAKVADPTQGITSYEPIGDIANDTAAMDAYVERVMLPRLTDMTGGHPDLVEAVRTGHLSGRRIYRTGRTHTGSDISVVDKRAAETAKALLDAGYGPRRSIKIREALPKIGTDLSHAKAYGKHALDTVFLHVVDLPDRILNREPVWSQLQWKHSIESAPWLSADDLARLKRQASAAKISPRQMAELNRVKTDVTATDRLTLPQLTKLSKYNAAHDMKAIVHDLKSRSQFFDMVKMLVPFGDAFRLVATRMAKLAHDEPQVLRRLAQGLQEARSPGSGTVNQLMGDPTVEGQPLFHDDPRTGEEVVTLPGSTSFNEAVWNLVGAGHPLPLPMVSKVGGWNMLSDVYPGFGGPVVTIAGKWLLPQDPAFDTIRDIVYPYGGDESSGNLGGDILGPFIPSWASKVFQGPPDQRALASEVNNQIKVLMDSGDYDQHDARDMATLANDARDNAYWIYMMRGAAQFAMPGSPSFEYNVHDKDGKLMALNILGDKVRKESDGDPDKGIEWLRENFGSKNMFAIQAGSRSLAYSPPVSRTSANWVKEHPEVKDAAPLVYGFFAPKGKADDIDNWMHLFATGDEVPLSAEAQIAAAENKLGWYAYSHAQKVMKDKNHGRALSDSQQAWNRGYRAYLKEQFPGFDTFLAAPYDSAKRRTSAIEQLYKMRDNDAASHTDAGRGLDLYLEMRDEAMAKYDGLKGRPASPFQAKSGRGTREWLRGGAEWVIERHPDFRPIWEQLLRYEMTEDPS